MNLILDIEPTDRRYTTDDGVKVSIDVQSDKDPIKPMLALVIRSIQRAGRPGAVSRSLWTQASESPSVPNKAALGPTNPQTAHFLALVRPTHGLKDGFLYTLRRNETLL